MIVTAHAYRLMQFQSTATHCLTLPHTFIIGNSRPTDFHLLKNLGYSNHFVARQVQMIQSGKVCQHPYWLESLQCTASEIQILRHDPRSIDEMGLFRQLSQLLRFALANT